MVRVERIQKAIEAHTAWKARLRAALHTKKFDVATARFHSTTSVISESGSTDQSLSPQTKKMCTIATLRNCTPSFIKKLPKSWSGRHRGNRTKRRSHLRWAVPTRKLLKCRPKRR